jgi:hypothetical protein
MELIAGTVGVGWIVWRGVDYLPKELIFELHYLGEVRFAYGYKVPADDRPTTRSTSTSLDPPIPSLVRCSIVSYLPPPAHVKYQADTSPQPRFRGIPTNHAK